MVSNSMLKRALVAVALATDVVSQAIHTVMVGDRGSFYNPPTQATLDGDVLHFVFVAGLHGVTQSTFDAPCAQLDGGFNSGLLTGPGVNSTVPYPTWDLTVVNASQPIFYFCQATVPVSHCASGMVGAINVPADQYESFTAAAKTVSGTPTPQTSAVLTGVGAFATALPTQPPAPSTTTTSTSSTSTPVQTSPPPSTKSKSSNIAPIVGGVVGGCAVVIIGVLAFLLWRSKRNHRNAANGVGETRTGFNNTGMGEESKGYLAPQGTGSTSGPFPPVQGFYNNTGSGPYQQPGTVLNADSYSTPIAAPVPVSYSRELGFNSGEVNPNTASTGASYATAFGSANDVRSSPPQVSAAFSNTSDGYNRMSNYTDIGSANALNLSHPLPSPSLSLNAPPPPPAASTGANVNYHELAKEVAAILGPQIRSSAASPPPSSQTANTGMNQPMYQSPIAQQLAAQLGVSGANRGQANVAPRLPFDYPDSPIGSSRSPGPPQYERFEQQ